MNELHEILIAGKRVAVIREDCVSVSRSVYHKSGWGMSGSRKGGEKRRKN